MIDKIFVRIDAFLKNDMTASGFAGQIAEIMAERVQSCCSGTLSVAEASEQGYG